MTRPPALGATCGRTVTVAAYAKPTTQRYITRPLSSLHITVVKQFERVEIYGQSRAAASTESQIEPSIPLDGFGVSAGSFAGCGVLTVKRNIHGYKKLSLVTREELSRSELALPDMEFDTFGFWLDCDASIVGRTMLPQNFGYGIHALSHAICNVAPLFVPCVLNDVECDHSVYNPTRVVIFDARGEHKSFYVWTQIQSLSNLVKTFLPTHDISWWVWNMCSAVEAPVQAQWRCPCCHGVTQILSILLGRQWLCRWVSRLYPGR
jgi:hypothetical protein